MANETITFSCAACGVNLTVPASLAGVSGPCPSCGAEIQAPSLVTPTEVAAKPAQVNRAKTPPVQIPVRRARPTSIPSAPVQSAPPVPAAAEPAPLKPEPRHMPSRSNHTELLAKQMPEPTPSGSLGELKAAPVGRHPYQPSLLARFLMLILFVIASGALVFGVLTVLNMQKTNKGEAGQNPPPSQVSQILTEPLVPMAAEDAGSSRVPALPTPEHSQSDLIGSVPDLPKGLEPRPRGLEALEVLEKFLAAKSLSERLPMIETHTPEAELAASCLAGPLPRAPKMLLEFQESNPMEEMVDFYYSVDFGDSDQNSSPQMILVRIRGREKPKVVVDPFLDLFGGRLAAYVSKPSDEAGVFQVVASALASCTNKGVPNREKKLTLKLLARDNTKEIAEAYFSKISEIGEMLEDGTYSLSYGKAKACTVMLRWNTEEDPKMPYLEAIMIKALDWNP